MNQQEEKNLEHYLTRNCEWHVVWRLSATECWEMSACASMLEKVSSGRIREGKNAAEVYRTA